jgi:Carboxypeptidase regulatory-like domain/TonB dependent receptor
MKRTFSFLLLVSVFFLIATATLTHAQLTEGTIAATVKDPSGAAVTNAKIKVLDVNTGLSAEESTNATGYVRVVHLSPGTYRLQVEAPGFKSTVVENVVVNVNVVTSVDVSLQVGSTAETIEVAATTPLVQTEEGRLADTVSTREVTDLPLNGREVYQLVALEPGVTATNAPVVSNVSSPTSSTTFDSGFIANGATPRGNNFILDGNSNNNEWLGGTPLIFPSLDAIEEVQVQTLDFSAEYGRNNGAIVNIVTKSGTNKLHGDVFYSGRNTAFNASNYFDKVQKTPLQQHQFGFALGGPIVKDKTFFFLDYEGSRLKDGAPIEVTTETPQFRNYVISTFPTTFAAMFYKDFPGPACLPGTAIATGSVIPGDPVNVGPPNPAVPDTCQGVSSQIAPNQADQYTVRVDHHINAHDSLYGRWIATKSYGDVARDELSGANIRGFTAPQDGFFADLGLGYTHEISSNTLNDLRFAFSRNNSRMSFGMPANTETASVLKASGRSLQQFGTLFFDDGTIPIGGEIFNPRDFVFNTFAVNDILTHIAGRHALKFGVEVRRIQENSDYQLLTNPFYEFTSKFNFADDQPYLVSATIGRSSYNFGQFTATPRHFRWTQWAGFVQDDWKVRPNLTLNLGLRYSIFAPPTETNGLLNNIILGTGGTLPERMTTATVGRVKQLWNTDYHDFAPRFGLSWDPTNKGNTAIRAGFGLAYNEAFSNLWSNGSRFDPPDTARVVEDPVFGVGTTLNYTFPFQPSPDFAGPARPNGGVQGINMNLYGTDPNLTSAYAEQWFLGIQQAFLHDYGLSVNYVGTHGVGNYTREDYNRFAGDICNATTCDFTINRLNPGWNNEYYTSNEGNSIYHGLNAQLRKNYTHGGMWTANYTFGKVLDNVTEGNLGDYFNVNGYSALYTGVQDIAHPNADRGPSEFDVRQRFTLSGVWDLPSPLRNGVLGQIIGGWKLNPIISLQSGRPFDVYCGLAWFQGCDFNMDGIQYDRPNRPANLRTSGFSNQQFVSGVFGSPTSPAILNSTAVHEFCPGGIVPFFSGTPCLPVGTDGNLSRNAFRGPAFKSVDLGLFKDFQVRERAKVEFRAEAFNLFNRVNLWNPIGDMGSPQFGQSTSAFAARELQLGLKIDF